MVYKIIIITLLGGLLRYVGLDHRMWIDEAWFSFMSMHPLQEYPSAYLNQLLPQTEFWIRFPFFICGTLTIPAVYWVLEGNRGLYAASIVAFLPLFVFWSTMARPYAFAGLFMVLGWRYWYLHILAIVTTPIAFVGVHLRRQWMILILGLFVAVVIFFLRPDSGRDFWSIHYVINNSRLWYLPALAGIMYIYENNNSNHTNCFRFLRF